MIRAVLDTNTIVSGLGWGGPPGAVLDVGLAGRYKIVTSPTLLEEPRRVLGYPKLQAVIGDADQLIKLLALVAIGSPHGNRRARPRPRRRLRIRR